ncbi:hypothetical protein NC652_020298 [Populus alba x Populus x berolinensis]|uniref:Uncharacterized protein n=1 Tax=Populus alba x Populus x berolinensis TaxID=444605 RepID=A0AAD6MK11_9ROSI|nr:hypothetical protein NC652_020298 [Populus alba x Populus x berolinensis]KAJ6986776.1 hypothetical protein NC653_020113 [Populus alba x Populus x berolinensis]
MIKSENTAICHLQAVSNAYDLSQCRNPESGSRLVWSSCEETRCGLFLKPCCFLLVSGSCKDYRFVRY